MPIDDVVEKTGFTFTHDKQNESDMVTVKPKLINPKTLEISRDFIHKMENITPTVPGSPQSATTNSLNLTSLSSLVGGGNDAKLPLNIRGKHLNDLKRIIQDQVSHSIENWNPSLIDVHG